jgi:hypothetical protein
VKKDYRIFKKNWKSLGDCNEKMKLILDLNNHKYFEDMVHSENLEADMLLDYIMSFGSFIFSEIFKILEKENITDVLHCLKSILNHSNFPKLRMFVGKKHKTPYSQIQENKNTFFNDEDAISLFDSIAEKLLV